MGLDEAAMLSVVLSMAPRMFYKSMTTLNDHHIWQDVYHVPAPAGKTAYIKVTGYTDERAPVIQFKEK
jgi:motility quorum-sensing regulator/GCU-specific mRNA interferase toxin